jgi:hypothetical protein
MHTDLEVLQTLKYTHKAQRHVDSVSSVDGLVLTEMDLVLLNSGNVPA